MTLIAIVLVTSGCGSSNDNPVVDPVVDPIEITPPTLNTGETVKFTLLQTTDVHHRAIGTGPFATYGTGTTDQTTGGYARIATKITEIRSAKASEGTPVVLVDSGDYLMGTVYDLTLGGVPAAMSFIGLMKYDAITLGNHEFDYGPAPLAGFLDKAMGKDRSSFQVPVVASNMVTASGDAEGDDEDDGLEALIQEGRIKDSLLITLPNGLKVGLLGLLGAHAESDAPLAKPVSFQNDLSDPTHVAFIQARVKLLRDAGAHVVIAMSHSGLTKAADGSYEGNDVDLAKAVTGIDIIASGHDHEMTVAPVTPEGTDTRIICAGSYGENLAQLDVTVKIGTGVTDAEQENHSLTSDVALSSDVSFMVALLDGGINEALGEASLPAINDIIAFNASTNVEKPCAPTETGMGNLVSDSLRYLAGPDLPALGLVANGVIRNGFIAPQGLTFADIYSVLPLGMTLDPDNQDIPGYPLLNVLMDKTSIGNLCQLIALTEAASDSEFMNGLFLSGNESLLELYGTLLNLSADYYMNLSGIRFNHYGRAGYYQVDPFSIQVYAPGDFKCQAQSPAFPLTDLQSPDLPTMLPCVLDLYMVLMLQDPGLQKLLADNGLKISAYTPSEIPEPVTIDNVLSCRLDQDQNPDNGIQEVKEWMALLTFLTSGEEAGGFSGNSLTNEFYGVDAITDGEDTSRVNVVPPPIPE